MIFSASILALTLAGAPVTRIAFMQKLDRVARLAIAFACGVFFVSVAMFVMSVVHLGWSRAALLIVLALLAAFWKRTKDAQPASATSWLGIASMVALLTYGALTARITCADLMYFWGPKGIHFAAVGRIDPTFLGWSNYFLMHSDYPPLVPLVYAWGATFAHAMSWWGALLLTPLAVLVIDASFRGIAATSIGDEKATRFATLLAAVLTCAFAVSMVGGGGDPILVLFECIALCALTFAPDDRGALALAAIAL